MNSASQNALQNACFTDTLNQMGYMARKLDKFQQAFVDFCKSPEEGRYLDVGAAFGVATLPVLHAGKKIVSCDLDLRHLEAIRQAVTPEFLDRLVLREGHFPETVHFEPETFDGVLFAMVLHFVLPEDVAETLTHLREILTPEGRVFVTVSSPYQGTLKSFFSVYEARLKKGDPFPGYIDNIADHVPHRSHQLPPRNIVYDMKALRGLFEKHGFHVLECSYFTRENLPSDLSYDGREYTGLIATRA